MKLGTGRGYAIGTAAVAFLFWGGWAFAVNYGATTAARLTAGLVQGTASGIITLLMVRAVTWLYRKLPDRPGRLVLPAVLTVCVTGSALALIHGLAGTPRIPATIAPGLTVAFVFCLYTAYMVRRQTEGRINHAGD